MSITQETLDQLQKGFTQPATATEGLQGYNLEQEVKSLFPVLTPLRNIIPRITDGYSIQANWKAITGINTSQIGIGLDEGQRGYSIETDTKDYYAKFAFFGLNDFATFEATYSADRFINLLATKQKNLVQAVMIQEEQVDYAGNATFALGKTPSPVLATATNGGKLANAQTISVICVALSQKGFNQVRGLNNGTVGQSINIASAKLKPTFTLTDEGDGKDRIINGGTAQASDAVTVTTGAGATNSITATVGSDANPVVGAFGFAWFWGAAGAEKLGAVTHLNSVVITDTAKGTVLASAFVDDRSTDSRVYDGVVTQILKAGSGSYVRALPTGVAGVGSKLTSDGAGGVVEIEQALATFWDNYRLVPDKLFVSRAVYDQIATLVGANNGNPLVRYNADAGSSTGLVAGLRVIGYTEKVTGKVLQIIVHPNAIEGSILFYTDSVPYQVSDSANILVKRLRRDYHQIEWPLRTRKYEYGIYFDGVLQNYFPPAFGLIYNIAV